MPHDLKKYSFSLPKHTVEGDEYRNRWSTCPYSRQLGQVDRSRLPVTRPQEIRISLWLDSSRSSKGSCPFISRYEVRSIRSAIGTRMSIAELLRGHIFVWLLTVLTFSQGLHGIHPACGEGRQIACQCRHEKQDRGSAEQTQRIGWAEAEEHSGERAAHKKGDRQAEADTDGDQHPSPYPPDPQLAASSSRI
jgi:hypothetical protein